MKKILSFLLAFVLICSLPVSALAISDSVAQKTSDLRTIALNAPDYFGHDQEWFIVQETPLYDANDVLAA